MCKWKIKKVGDLGEIKTGKTPKTSITENYGGIIPFLTPSDDMSVKYVTDTIKHLTNRGLQEVKNVLLPKNSVCVSCIGSDLGKVVITTEPTVTNQQINSIIVNTHEYDVDFCYYSMLQLGKILNYHSKTSTAVPIVNKSSFSDYEILIPDLETQQKISSVLSALDNKISINNSTNNNLEQQAQAIFKSWFVDFEPFGGTMPVDWIRSDIYSIANIIYGAPFSSSKFNSSNIGKPIVRIRDLKSEQLCTYTDEVHPKGYLIQLGDIVVGMDGEFRPYLWGNDEAWLNQRVCVFENKKELDKAFVYFTIKPLLNLVEKTEVATTVIHIGKNDFDKFELYLPKRSILDSFGEITKPMIDNIIKNKLENKRLCILRDTLLPKLMSGEIDVDKVEV